MMPSDGMIAFSCGGAGSLPAIHRVAHRADTPLIPMSPVHQPSSTSHAIVSADSDSGAEVFSGSEPN